MCILWLARSHHWQSGKLAKMSKHDVVIASKSATGPQLLQPEMRQADTSGIAVQCVDRCADVHRASACNTDVAITNPV